MIFCIAHFILIPEPILATIGLTRSVSKLAGMISAYQFIIHIVMLKEKLFKEDCQTKIDLVYSSLRQKQFALVCRMVASQISLQFEWSIFDQLTRKHIKHYISSIYLQLIYIYIYIYIYTPLPICDMQCKCLYVQNAV